LRTKKLFTKILLLATRAVWPPRSKPWLEQSRQ